MKAYLLHLKLLLKNQVTRNEIKIVNPADKWRYSIAYLISRVLGPLPLICVLWIVTAMKSGIGFWRAVWVYPLIFFIDVAIPILITTYLIYSKRVNDLEWSDLKQRNKYLFPLVLLTTPVLLVLTYFLPNSTTFHLSVLLSTIALAVLAVYRFLYFKISGHIAVATIVFCGINLYFNLSFLWLFLLLIPIGWSRYTLKVHTIKELIFGFLLPISIILAAVLIFGWPQVPK